MHAFLCSCTLLSLSTLSSALQYVTIGKVPTAEPAIYRFFVGATTDRIVGKFAGAVFYHAHAFVCMPRYGPWFESHAGLARMWRMVPLGSW
jgi:hypothetical protein